MKMKKLVLAFVTVWTLIFALLLPQASWAAVDMFIKIGGLVGTSQDPDHTGEIDVLGFSFGLSQSGTMHLVGGSGAGKVNIQDVFISKFVDQTTPELMQATSDGTQFAQAKITFRKSDGFVFLTYTLKNVIITSTAIKGSPGSGRMTEGVTLNFAQIIVTYQPQLPNGLPDGGVITYGWDTAANIPL